MRRFRVVRGGDSHPSSTNSDDSTDPALAERLRAAYAPPQGDGYWDGLEATIMAAVRAGRTAPAAAVEWWHTLARWARPGLAAATVMLGVIGGVLLQTNGARDRVGIEDRSSALEPLDEDLARTIDRWSDSVSREERDEARAAADLLTDGVKRRPALRLNLDTPAASVPAAAVPDSVRSRREATFRSVVP